MCITNWIIRFILLFILVAALGVASLIYYLAKQAEPDYSGSISLPGLGDEVHIVFGTHAVPTIHAASQKDLFFAQGYLEASERMWQMDVLRRVARGRLAEVFGEEALGVDQRFRTLGLERSAKQSLAALPDSIRRYMSAYAAGVNAYQTRTRSKPALEYRIAGFRPAPWQPLDSLAIGEYMAYRVSFNLQEELAYLCLAQRLGSKRVLELFPTDEGVPAPSYARELPSYAGLAPQVKAFLAQSEDFLPIPFSLPASNSWVVAGSRTDSGGPLLANDPHLAPAVPSIWYELELQAPGFHAVGVSLPGVPFITIGHNEYVAWGFTAATADTQDLFVERLTDEGNAVERANGNSEAIESFTEAIAIKDWTQPYVLEIRTTSNGVLLDSLLTSAGSISPGSPDLSNPYRLALRWNLEIPDLAAEGLYRMNTAQSIEQLEEGIDRFRHPAQNVVFAHRDGTIGWKISGALPIRRRGLGTFPAPGWTGEYGWTGYLPPEQNPSTKNPASGRIIAANNRMLPLDYLFPVSHSWMAPFRALRIRKLLENQTDLSPGAMAQIQGDRQGLEPLRYFWALQKLKPELETHHPRAWNVVRDGLLGWDREFSPESQAAAFFVLLRQSLYEELFGDELEGDLIALTAIANEAYNALMAVVYSGESSFWDDMNTPAEEQPADIWARAILNAQNKLEEQQGNIQQARLERLRRLVFPHAFHSIPWLGRWFDVGPIGVGGDDHTVNVTKASLSDPRHPTVISSVRMIMTPSNWLESRGTLPLGQSGHRFSPYRKDQLQDWLAAATHRWHWHGPADGKVIGELRLVPSQKG